jgi:hypothetical protein
MEIQLVSVMDIELASLSALVSALSSVVKKEMLLGRKWDQWKDKMSPRVYFCE